MKNDFKFELDLDQFVRDLKATPDEILEGTSEGLDQIKDDWVRGARDVAPLDSGNLRKQIDGKVDDLNVLITANATNKSNGYGTFNYGYWLHEVAPADTNLSTPGTILKFLDQTPEERREEWFRWIEEEIETKVKRRGWR